MAPNNWAAKNDHKTNCIGNELKLLKTFLHKCNTKGLESLGPLKHLVPQALKTLHREIQHHYSTLQIKGFE